VAPAGERLEAADGAGAKVDERLEGKVERFRLDRAAQLGLDREAPAGRSGLVRLVDLDVAARLGPLQGELGVAKYLLGQLLMTAQQRAADRAVDAYLELREPERRGKRGADSLGGLERILEPALETQKDAELVAAGSGEEVVRAQSREEAAGEGDQQLVAGQRTDALVDPAESAHVDDEDGVAAGEEARVL
jgi:hypothetical protein